MNYSSYQDYLRHQQSKQKMREANPHPGMDEQVKDYESKYVVALQRRLVFCRNVLPEKGRALCLGSRSDAEIHAVDALGFRAVGLDLYPAKTSKRLLRGDFHFIPFAKETFEVVYTNSLDHSLMPDKLFSEVFRILKHGGVFVLEFLDVSLNTGYGGAWECFIHKTNQDVVDAVVKTGLQPLSHMPFEVPWWGISSIFRKE